MSNMNDQPNERLATQVTVSQAISMIIKAIKAKKVVMLKGSPAIGKSSIVHTIGAMFNLKVIDLRLSQCDPTDLNGFPHFINGRACYMPMNTFPIEGDPLPVERDEAGNVIHTYAGWILFLDEFNSATRAVQAGSYKLVLDHMVGMNRLHKNVAIVCAGNKESDGAIVEEMSTALQSRLTHLELVLNVKEWIEWAAKEHVDYRIISYIDHQQHQLYTFKPDHTDDTYASPRTWKFVDDYLKVMDLKDPDFLPLASGTIGEGVAREFNLFCKIADSLPPMSAIIAAPDSVIMPLEPSVMFMLCGSISHHVKDDTVAPLMKFILRMPIEFQIVCLRYMIRRNEALKKHPEVQKWLMINATHLF